MIVRIVSPGWENFTGSMGHQAMFKNGVSVGPLNARQIARIGSSLRIVNDETGEQVGPSSTMQGMQLQTFNVAPVLKTARQAEKEFEFDRDRLEAEENARKKADAKALEEAKAKAESEVEELVVYSRAELEAIAANDGIGALRPIGDKLNVKGRSISDLVNSILKAQAQLTAGE